MAGILHILPDRCDSAAANMAFDFLLLQRYEPKEAFRLRHYDWSQPSFTFGLSQKHELVLGQPGIEGSAICRRPTGGGIVSHLDDWTYSVVVPSSSPFSRGQPLETYRIVHEAILDALLKQGSKATLQGVRHKEAMPGVCFDKPELFDVVQQQSGKKIAGAAQKRSKSGLLLQGSVWKPHANIDDWELFYADFADSLSSRFSCDKIYATDQQWEDSELCALIEQFESEEWIQRR